MSRGTIHQWVKTGQLERDLGAAARGYTPRPAVAHKLDPYKGIIDASLEEFAQLSAKRLFDEVRAAGYPCCYESVRNYVRVVRPQEPIEPVASRRRRDARAKWTSGRSRFPGAGVMPQWWSWATPGCCGCASTPGRRWRSLMQALESAFERFGGVPEELLFDQMRAVVLSDDRVGGGSLVLNAEFLRFAAHWGFLPRSCRPYRARTKGTRWNARFATSATASSTVARS